MAEDPENLFPSFDDGLAPVLLDDDLEDDIVSYVPEPYGGAWEYDFEAGDLAFSDQGQTRYVTGVEALRQWCRHVILTQRGQSPLINPGVGTDLGSLLGGHTTDPYVQARILQEIKQALELHDRIESVEMDDLIPSGHNAFVFVTIKLDTGEEIADAIGL